MSQPSLARDGEDLELDLEEELGKILDISSQFELVDNPSQPGASQPGPSQPGGAIEVESDSDATEAITQQGLWLETKDVLEKLTMVVEMYQHKIPMNAYSAELKGDLNLLSLEATMYISWLKAVLEDNGAAHGDPPVELKHIKTKWVKIGKVVKSVVDDD